MFISGGQQKLLLANLLLNAFQKAGGFIASEVPATARNLAGIYFSALEKYPGPIVGMGFLGPHISLPPAIWKAQPAETAPDKDFVEVRGARVPAPRPGVNVYDLRAEQEEVYGEIVPTYADGEVRYGHIKSPYKHRARSLNEGLAMQEQARMTP
ncbi:MAG: hypothetical protein WC989_08260 [Micavibrio sp.]